MNKSGILTAALLCFAKLQAIFLTTGGCGFILNFAQTDGWCQIIAV
jgi:hypothetical protein